MRGRKKKNKTNLLHLITGLNVGGAEMMVHDLAKFATKEKFDVHIMALIKSNELLPMFHESGLDPIILGMDKQNKITFFKGIKKAIRYIRINDIKVIHAHMTHALLLSWVLKIVFPSLRIVFTSHNTNIESKWRELIVCLLKPFRKIDIVFSDLMLGKFYQKKKTIIIPNAIHVSKFDLDIAKYSVFTFIYVARFEHQKNHAFLLDMLTELKEQRKILPPFQILCVGKGSLYDEISEKIDAKELQSHIKLLGLRSDIPELLAQSHAFIMPSLWEGFPISILEAGASGLTVLATPVGSIPSIIDDKTGYISSLENFSTLFSFILNNQSDAINKGQRLKKKIRQDYSIDKIVNMHEEVYLSVQS